MNAVVRVGAQVRASSLSVSVALTDGQGQTGEYHEVTVAVIQSGVGDVKVTLSFEPTHDLDLENGGRVDTYRNRFEDRAEGTVLDIVTFTH